MTPAGDDPGGPPDRESNVASRKDGDSLMSQYEFHRASMTTHTMTPRLRRFAVQWEEWKREQDLLDFTDLIEVCLRDIPSAQSSPDVIFIDEAQDLDQLELKLIRKWGKQAGCLVLVGDPDQAIYEWRGADPQAFTSPVLPDGSYRVLDQSYRVPRQVHARAVQWINRVLTRDRVDYLSRPEEGLVKEIRATLKDPLNVIGDAEKYLAEGKTVMCLTSCAYMLSNLLKELRSQGIPFHNSYRSSSRDWNPLAQRGELVTMQDRVQAYLGFSQRGVWTARGDTAVDQRAGAGGSPPPGSRGSDPGIGRRRAHGGQRGNDGQNVSGDDHPSWALW